MPGIRQRGAPLLRAVDPSAWRQQRHHGLVSTPAGSRRIRSELDVRIRPRWAAAAKQARDCRTADCPCLGRPRRLKRLACCPETHGVLPHAFGTYTTSGRRTRFDRPKNCSGTCASRFALTPVPPPPPSERRPHFGANTDACSVHRRSSQPSVAIRPSRNHAAGSPTCAAAARAPTRSKKGDLVRADQDR